MPRLVRDTGDPVDGAVHVVGVAERDLPARLELRHELGIAVPAALAVLDRDHELLPELPAAGERARRALHGDGDVGAEELLLPVRPQHAGEQARLAEDLEAVADPEHRPARVREGADDDITGANRAIAPQRR